MAVFIVSQKMIKKLAISNIAWSGRDFWEGISRIREVGCSLLELAPSSVWEEPVNCSNSEVLAFRKSLADQGITIQGLHALLFSRPDLQLFASRKSRQECSDYLKRLIDLCNWLGGETLVFGSPRNREPGQLSHQKAFEIAVEFFKELAEYSKQANTYICLECLPKEDKGFLASTHEGAAMVELVNNTSFCLHLDTGAIAGMGELHSNIIATYGEMARHFHVNDPNLTPPGSQGLDHALIGSYLNQSGYAYTVSIEIRNSYDKKRYSLKSIIDYVRSCYLSMPGAQAE